MWCVMGRTAIAMRRRSFGRRLRTSRSRRRSEVSRITQSESRRFRLTMLSSDTSSPSFSRSYVLEQHLHRDEVIRAGSRQLGLFKGTEPVFARSSVVELKSVENYWREGRQVKDNEIPMKWVKSRVVTINRKRAEAVATMDGEAPSEKALYAREQTRVYVPDPVVNVSVPFNRSVGCG